VTLRVVADNTVANVEKLNDIAGMLRGLADEIEARDDVIRVVVLTDSRDNIHLDYEGDSLSAYEMIGLLDVAKDVAKRGALA
jgi:hypothetical protein